MDARERRDAELLALVRREIARFVGPALPHAMYVTSETPLKKRRRIPTRRAQLRLEVRLRELQREFEKLLLAPGGVERARTMVEEAGLSDCMKIATTMEELERMMAAALLWDNAWSDFGSSEGGVAGWVFWRE